MQLLTQAWHVEVLLSEHEGTTSAEARLHTGQAPPLVATGSARLSAHDVVDVPEIGFELAAARALGRLSALLEQTAEADVEELLHADHHGAPS
jgi:hypothetical protein